MPLNRAARALPLVLSALAACATEQAQSIESALVVRARTDDGRPLAGVGIQIGDDSLGNTDASGELEAMLSGTEGTLFRLEARCPPGHLDPGELPPVLLGRFATLAEKDGRLAVTVTCARQRRIVAVVVRARVEKRKVLLSHRGHRGKVGTPTGLAAVPGIPVLVNGKERARTDDHGLAHLAIEAPPDTHIEVVLQTELPALAMLNPRSPAQGLNVRGTDDVYPIDQTFTAERLVRLPPPPSKHVIRVIEQGLGADSSTLIGVGALKQRSRAPASGPTGGGAAVQEPPL